MGKQIAFWGPLHGQPGTTANIQAVAVAATFDTDNIKSLLVQTHYNLNNLERSLIGYKKDKESLIEIGIDELARSPKLAKMDKDTIYRCSVTAVHKKLYLLPGTDKRNREDFEKNTGTKLQRIFSAAEKYYDYVFVDTNAGNSKLTMEILNNSDLVVVNLCQNVAVIDKYFNDYNFEHKNVVYLIGDYERDSHYNLFNLKSKYKKLQAGRVAVIPHCVEFKDAQSDERTLQFIRKNIDCRKGKNEYFIKCIKEAEKIILQAAAEGGKSI